MRPHRAARRIGGLAKRQVVAALRRRYDLRSRGKLGWVSCGRASCKAWTAWRQQRRRQPGLMAAGVRARVHGRSRRSPRESGRDGRRRGQWRWKWRRQWRQGPGSSSRCRRACQRCVWRCLQARIEHRSKQQPWRIWHEFEAWWPRLTFTEGSKVIAHIMPTRQSKHGTSSWAGGEMAHAAAVTPANVPAERRPLGSVTRRAVGMCGRPSVAAHRHCRVRLASGVGDVARRRGSPVWSPQLADCSFTSVTLTAWHCRRDLHRDLRSQPRE